MGRKVKTKTEISNKVDIVLEDDERFIRGYKYKIEVFVGKNKVLIDTIEATFLGRSYQFLQFERLKPIQVKINSGLFINKKTSRMVSVHTSLINTFKQII